MQNCQAKILHLEMPRQFSLTIKPFPSDVCQVLASSRIQYRQTDLNFGYWSWLHGRDARGLRLSDYFMDPDCHPHRLCEVADHLQTQILSRSPPELSIDLQGTRSADPADSYSVAKLRDLAATPNVRSYFEHYYQQALCSCIDFSWPDIFSVGIDGPEGLLFAFALHALCDAEFPGATWVVGRHNYENFSLLSLLPQLVQSGTLFEVCAAVLLHDELRGIAYSGLVEFLRGKDETALCNIAIRLPSGIRVFGPRHVEEPTTTWGLASPAENRSLSEYFAGLPVHPQSLLYSTPLVGNQCYYSKCSFCVQINKHPAPSFYRERTQIANQLTRIAHLSNQMGVTNYLFADEALSPKAIDLLCDGIDHLGLRIDWACRMTLNPRQGEHLFSRMQQAGCRLVIFGLETVNPVTARFMGKITAGRSPEKLTLPQRREGPVGSPSPWRHVGGC